MNTAARTMILVAALCAVAAAARADTDWANVTFGPHSDFTMDVPAAVADSYLPPTPTADHLLGISLKSGASGSMFCAIVRSPYSKKGSRKLMASRLATTAREALCSESGDKVSGVSISSSRSFTTGGVSAAACTVSYTDASEEKPGVVESDMAIAAADGFYSFTCRVSDDDQETAEDDWSYFWGDAVEHMQNSLQLPASSR